MKIKIYTKDNCPKCNEIKSILNLKNIKYEETKLSGLNMGKIISQYPEAKSAPIVTVNDKYIDNTAFINSL